MSIKVADGVMRRATTSQSSEISEAIDLAFLIVACLAPSQNVTARRDLTILYGEFNENAVPHPVRPHEQRHFAPMLRMPVPH
jgi:hypothetical protein